MMWHHSGRGSSSLGGIPGNVYFSSRDSKPAAFGKIPDGFANPLEDLRFDLPGGVTCLLPLAVYATDKGTLPLAGSPPDFTGSAEAHPKSGNDRSVRLAGLILAWNDFEHFYPYFDVVRTDWNAELKNGLLEAASDSDGSAFFRTLQKMVAALHDGHGYVSHSGDNFRYGANVTWDFVEGKIVADQVHNLEGMAPGDVLLTIDKRPALEVLKERESLRSGATSQWLRWASLKDLTSCKLKGAFDVEIQRYKYAGEIRHLQLHCDKPVQEVREKRPQKTKEIEPGIFYVDLDQASDSDYEAILPQLTKAKSIIYDMRGYPGNIHNAKALFSNWTKIEIASPQWHIPQVIRPDRDGMTFRRSQWHISSAAPYLSARKIFLADGRAISYAETCIGIVEYYHLGEILGEPTAGTNGNINSTKLPGGYTINWTGMRVLRQDGSQHHGVGIQPTIVIHRTQAGIAAGRDEFLERAVQELRQ